MDASQDAGRPDRRRFAAIGSPLVAVNASGHALYAWNGSGAVRFSERVKSEAWTASRPVPGSGAGAGPVALAIGDNEVAAIAYATVATRYEPHRLLVSRWNLPRCSPWRRVPLAGQAWLAAKSNARSCPWSPGMRAGTGPTSGSTGSVPGSNSSGTSLFG